ncbi:MAG: efflux RND transporter permease subunit [Ignavibacteriaceae bacterium]|nr:efflux RND transporter permease subunit [Ignavibacteriaceae bacterium]
MNYMILLITLTSFSLIGQSRTDTLYLTLDDAIKKALKLNWDVQISSKDNQKSEEQVSEAYANVFPRIDFTGIVPVALGLGEGAEFRAPMGQAVIGGLITATLLTLFIVPVVYSILDDLGEKNVFGIIKGLISKKKEEPLYGK